MKICIVGDHCYPYVGGMETIYYNIAKGLTRREHSVRVVTSAFGEYLGCKTIEGMDVYYYPWKVVLGHPVVRPRDLQEHIEWADVVYTGPFMASVSSVKVAKNRNKPVVYHMAEIAGSKWKFIEENPIKAWMFRLIEYYISSRDYDYIQAVSNATKRDYCTYIKKKRDVEVIYDFLDEDIEQVKEQSQLDLKTYFDLPADKKVILYYGRPGKSKGLFVYYDALSKLIQKYGVECAGDYHFCFILGKEPRDLRERFVNKVSHSELSRIVSIRDPLPRADLLRAVSQSDIVVVPSITEGFGLSAAEACMLDRRIIYSDAGSLPEVVSGAVSSFKNMDSDDLCEKLRRVCGGEDIFTVIPKKHFDVDTVLDKLEEVFPACSDDCEARCLRIGGLLQMPAQAGKVLADPSWLATSVICK